MNERVLVKFLRSNPYRRKESQFVYFYETAKADCPSTVIFLAGVTNIEYVARRK